jgi:excisionase family DNA binding protein
MGLLGGDGVLHDVGDVAEAYRRAEQRLRLLLLGDGMNQPGVVKGEEARVRITTALRHMREAFATALEHDTGRAEEAHARASELQEELLRLASQAATARRESEGLLTASQVARELGLSVDAVYRAVRRNEIAAFRPGKGPRAALRIPASEIRRLRESGS